MKQQYYLFYAMNIQETDITFESFEWLEDYMSENLVNNDSLYVKFTPYNIIICKEV